MKIVIAVHHFPPHYTSGAENRAYRTAAWLHHYGHNVCVVCVESITSGDGGGLTFEDSIYDGLPVRRLSYNLAAASSPFRWSYDNPWIGQHLRDYLGETRPDILHLFSGYLMSGSTLHAASDLGVPVVVSLTDFWFLCPRITLLRSNGELCGPPFSAGICARCLGEERRRYRIAGRIAPGLMRAFWRRQRLRAAEVEERMRYLQESLGLVDAFISPSKFLRDFFVDAGISPERIIFSRQGRDFDLTPEVLSKIPSSHLRIGYMGQIAPHKGVDTLFEAVRYLPDAALEVRAYGDVMPFPRYSRRLRRMAAQDPRLRMEGTYERSEVGRVLQQVDVVAVPSLWYENSPNTILEAFAHRTPVIASRLGGMAELVVDGVNGLLFEPGDARDLAKQIRRLLSDSALLSDLRAGIGPVKRTVEEMGELEAVYQLAIRHRGSRVRRGSRS